MTSFFQNFLLRYDLYRMGQRLFLFFFLVVFHCSFLFSEDKVFPVLVLHSYHPGFTWTENEMKGIYEGFSTGAAQVDLYIEYLDAKRHSDPEVLKLFCDLLQKKLAGKNPSVVLTTDNIALQTALDLRPSLFPDAVVVFCGLNGSPEAVIKGRKRVTGVMETWDPKGTLTLISSLQPRVKEIVVLHDQTESGQGTYNDLQAVLPLFKDRFVFRFLPSQPMEKILKELSLLPDTSAVLLMGYNVDSEGKVIDSAESGSLIASYSRVPVYTMDQTRFNGGVVGGSLLSGERQGLVAAEMVKKILNGEQIENIPVIKDPLPLVMMEYRALERFGLLSASYPANAVLLNQPVSFYQQYKYRIWIFFIILIALILLSSVLTVNIYSRHKIEAKLRSNEENLRITLNSIGDAVIATDQAGGIVRMNPAAEKITGWKNGESYGKKLQEVFRIFSLDDGKIIESPVDRVLRRDKTAFLPDRKCTLIHRNGTKYVVSDSAAPILDTSGNLVGVVLVFRDVTQELNLQEKLHQSQRMEVLGQLAGGVAHDFNNILTAIMGSAELLLANLEAGSRNHMFSEEILNAATRAAELTRHLLAFSRKGQMRRNLIHVHPIIEEVIRLLARSIDKKIELKKELNADPDTLIGDTVLLQSAVLNMAVNARDAMPEGGVICFSTKIVPLDSEFFSNHALELTPGDYLQLSVSDNGEGMGEKIRQRLFEPYFTTKPAGKGTGLGLAAVYGCVKSHKGHIQVFSELGKGSVFKMYLPVTHGEGSEGETSSASEILQGKGLIFIVEDEEMVRNTAVRILKILGYQVKAFASGLEALEYFKSESSRPDLVILDMIMPQISGRELFGKLKEIDPKVRVLISSGYTDHQDLHAVLQEGALDFIHKPFKIDELSRMIHQYISVSG